MRRAWSAPGKVLLLGEYGVLAGGRALVAAVNRRALGTTNPAAPPFGLIGGNKVLTGSNIGGIAETQEMLDFCAEHALGATIETIDASDPGAVDAAWDRVVAGDVRYRCVIDTATIPG